MVEAIGQKTMAGRTSFNYVFNSLKFPARSLSDFSLSPPFVKGAGGI